MVIDPAVPALDAPVYMLTDPLTPELTVPVYILTEPRSTGAPSGAVERRRSSDHDRESVHIKKGMSGARQ